MLLIWFAVHTAHLSGTNEHSVNFEDNFSLTWGISKNSPLYKGWGSLWNAKTYLRF